MRLGNDVKGNVNGTVLLTAEDIDLLLECIWRFTNLMEDYEELFQSEVLVLEKQFCFMKEEMGSKV